MKVLKFNEQEILDISNYHKIDYYYLEDSIDLSIIREKRELIENNMYRGIVTFVSNINHFVDFDCLKIALINYPPIRYTKRFLISQIELCIENHVDEIEFPWNNKYFFITKEEWQEIISLCQLNGMKLRPMMEFGIWDKDYIVKCIDFFKEIGIMSLMCSTGLVSEIMTYKYWEEIKNCMPRFFEVKVGGLLTIMDINKFLASDVDLCSTTINFKSNDV